MAVEPRVAVVGPLPPPSGGMANQCRQLVRLMESEGIPMELVRTNAPYRPTWVGGIPVLRAFARLLPYIWTLWRAAGRNQIFHIFANSGWAWHLFAAPAVVIGRLRGVKIIVNYRGGNAEPFLRTTTPYVVRMLGAVDRLVTPSGFLKDVFARFGLQAQIVSNIVDLTRFRARERDSTDAPHLIVTRNLEPIYDIPTAIRAYARVRSHYPAARLTVAGTGPDLAKCELLAQGLGVADGVRFAGRIDNDQIPELYASADVALNPSTVDNMPISILEAYGSGVPVVTTDVGGIPYIAIHDRTALLVRPGDDVAMAASVCRLLGDSALVNRLVEAGQTEARAYAWPHVKEQWLAVYRSVLDTPVR
ncbi:MAG: glycosyltransferase family 4 protein [Zoogloea sp.]|nr:glycosyltransferase family 4 protein [Zoogloea sp.]